MRFSFNWMHLKDDTTALLQNINIDIILSFTQLCNFCPLHLCLIFFQKSCLLRTPLNLFSGSLLLASTSGLICHKESASASIHESYTKWARETPGLSDIWVLRSEWAGLAQQLRGPTLCCRRVESMPHKATHCCTS